MIRINEGNIALQEKKLLVIGRVPHKPQGEKDEWKPFEGEFDSLNLTDLYSALGLALLGKAEGDSEKPIWRIYQGKNMVGLYHPRGQEMKKRFLLFLLATSKEEKRRTRFPLNDLSVRALMRQIEVNILRGEHSCVFPDGGRRTLAVVRKPDVMTFILPNSHADIDEYGRALLLGSVERVITDGEARPFEYEGIKCFNVNRSSSPVPMFGVQGDWFRIDLKSALKLKVLCQ